jgi:Cytochrome c7 and related cytochrome c/Cytochrome c554 and c-prime
MNMSIGLQKFACRARVALAALLWLLMALITQPALAQGANQKDFDHLKTGFALTGKHIDVRCESCHQNGVLKGTPRDCASCHLSGKRFARGNVVMPQQHIPTQATCETCHSTKSFVGAKFNHAGVAPGSCQTCHNGTLSAGKPSNHIQTNASCDSCHRTTAWSPAANFDHSGVVAGTCATCHGAGRATGKSPAHMPTNAGQSCDDCHKSFSVWRPTAWNHTQMATSGQCASCHSGGTPPADGKPTNHVPYASVGAMAAANCDACHKGSFSSWANGRVHANFAVAGSCASCHSGGFLNAVGKPNTAVHNGVTNCESCHNTSGWAGAKVDHSTFSAATNCASCHNGTTATAKPATHMPTGATSCFACHGVSPAGWKPTKWTHTQVAVAAQCATCHSGGYPPADGKPGNHIPYQSVALTASANCDSCHKGSFTSWANGKLHTNHAIGTGCVGCHSGAYLNAVGKPNNATHASVTGNCESCHKSTASWAGAKTDHSTFTTATNCASCHNGTAGTAKPANHMPTTANCLACHNVSPALWTPTKWNHTQATVTAQCATCHTGGYPPADGKPGNHIPYQSVALTAAANCDSCHKGSFTTWANGRLHSNYSLATGCVSCHSGAYLSAVGKPNNATHASVTGNCESCHKSTATWAGAKTDHSTFTAATTCATCHNGSTATGKPGNHMPTTANCLTCHNVSPALWTPTKWNHTQVVVAAQCASCHTGGYPPADGRPSNHIPYQTVALTAAANCDACHKGSFTTWTNGRLHANYTISTGCFSCHTGAYLNAVGKPNTATHTGVTGNCESCHKSTASWATVTFAHSPANAVGTGTCDTCHNGSTAKGKTATHIPIPAGAARCDSCHKSQASFATATTMNHSVVTTGTCKSCHNGAYVSQGNQGALAKPSNHIPEVQLLNGAAMDCNACHTGTAVWTSVTMNHNNSQGNGAGWCKGCHTSGQAFLGNMEKKSLTHQRSTGVTDCSQSGCHRPLGNRGTPYRSW